MEKGLKRLTLVFSLLAGPFVFFYLCISTDDWPEPLHFIFLFLLIFEVIGFVAVWIIYCPTRWIVKGFNDEEKKFKVKAMNLERGFRRITLLTSIVVGLAVASLCFVLIFEDVDYSRAQYTDYKEDYENIVYFWRIWDANGWTEGNRWIVNYLENNSYRAAFTFDNKTIYLDAQDVFPGIYKNMSNLPLNELEKKAQNAKKKAIQKVKLNMERYAYWGEKIFSGIVLIAIGIALFIGVIGYSIVWLLFFLMRWLALGFSYKVPSRPSKTTTKLRTFIAVCAGIVFGLSIGIIAHFIWLLEEKVPNQSYTLDDHLAAGSTKYVITPLDAECLNKYINGLLRRIPPNDIPPPPPPGIDWLKVTNIYYSIKPKRVNPPSWMAKYAYVASARRDKNEPNSSYTIRELIAEKVFHRPSCEWAQDIRPDRLIGFDTWEEAIESGRKPCGGCILEKRNRLEGLLKETKPKDKKSIYD